MTDSRIRTAANVKERATLEFERLNPRQFERFRDFIYANCGIRVDERKVALLSNRIRRRLKAGGYENFDVYYRFLTSAAGVGELECFWDAITTNETFFFRTEKHFDWLTNEFLTELIAQQRAGKRPSSLRIWSAGCASGAEPYTIAICLAENIYRLRDWSLHVLGTDISEEALQVARGGVFNSRSVAAVTEKQRKRCFQHQTEHGLWQVRPTIKQLVEFKKHNLMTPLPELAYDCIFIRNVLIYFDRESKRVVIKHLLDALAVGGYLAVGPSEGIYDMLEPLQRISPLLYQKVGKIASRNSDGAGTRNDD